jgi:2-hydroxychromene-2-carboxylate isomerase
MAKKIDFYFDFSSPYGYLAAQSVEDLGARWGREVAWRPFLLGAAFKESGSQPLLNYPIKGSYALHDMRRSARRLGVPFTLPEPFPFASVAACRAFYALADDRPEDAKRLAQALYGAAFGRGLDIGPAQAMLEVAAEIGLDKKALGEAIQSPEIKQRLRDEVEAGIKRGVFGSPFLIVDGEAFWGNDRLSEVEDWLKTGGW